MLIPFYWVLPVKFIGYHALTPPLWTYKPFVTSNSGNRDSSKDSNKGMDMGNNMGSMGMGNDIHLVEGDGIP
jgi:hypothetical protein